MSLVIARAGMEAVPEADALIHEAADWLIAKGEPLWGPNETSFEELVRVARTGELVMGRLAGEALYVHRLAVARKFAGRGFARAMLDWSEDEVRSRGRRFLRLDCEPREKLLGLYRSAGFVPVDSKPIQVGPHFVVRHEKPILRERT